MTLEQIITIELLSNAVLTADAPGEKRMHVAELRRYLVGIGLADRH